MNNWKQLETLLQSWIPRRPSDNLKAAIFRANPEADEMASLGLVAPGAALWKLFAPAAACCLTFLVLFGGNSLRYGSGASVGGRQTLAMMSLTSSNQGANLPAKYFGLTAVDLN